MTISEFFLQLNPIVSIFLIISTLALLLFISSKGIEITKNNNALKIFGKEKKNFSEILEKTVEISFQITYLKDRKKLETQLNYTEQAFEEIINIYEKTFRSLTEDSLNENNLPTLDLEKHPDFDAFKTCLKIIKLELRNVARMFFREFFVNYHSLNLDQEKEKFTFLINKKRDDLLNELYKDQVGTYERLITRSVSYRSLKDLEVKINHVLKEICNNAIAVEKKISIEIEEKKQILEKFLKDNL